MKFKRFGALLLSAVLCIGMAAPAFAFEGDSTPVEQPVLPEIVAPNFLQVYFKDFDRKEYTVTPDGG